MYTFKSDFTIHFSKHTLLEMGKEMESRRIFSGLSDQAGIVFAKIKATYFELTGKEMVFEEPNPHLPAISPQNASTSSHTYFRLVTSTIGDMPSSYDSQYFDTFQAAVDHFKKNYTERNEGDRHDAYWNNIPLRVQSVTTVITSLY